MSRPVLTAQALVHAPSDGVRRWFLSLQEEPERYQFDTHAGFEFVEGDFGEIGARFKTLEEFLFLRLELLFELTEVSESEFSFRLVRPMSLRIWGRFDIEGAGKQKTWLSLNIGSETRVGQLILRCYPVAAAVRRQIQREVRHIKTSIESRSSG